LEFLFGVHMIFRIKFIYKVGAGRCR
jgi:hypothetical protein